MNHTPFSHLTNREAVRHVYNKEEVTDAELDLAQRLELSEQQMDDLVQQVQCAVTRALASSTPREALLALQRLTAPVHSAVATPLVQ
jgi:hypothetical protein